LTPSCVHPKGGAASSALIFSNASPLDRNFGKWFACDRRCVHEAAPIRYVAEFLGLETDSEKVIRWLIALMVLCCAPLAVALRFRRRDQSPFKTKFGPSPFDTCRADAIGRHCA
jgi:hypothetical protein